MLNRFFKALAAVVFLCFSVNSFASAEVNSEDPYELIKTLADNTFSAIKANKDKLGDTSVSRGIIRTELLPYIDNKYAALKVINQNLKQTNEEQRNRFVSAFTDYIIATYADALKKYTSQTAEVQKPNKVDADDGFTSVKVFVKEAGAPDIEVIFKLRKNKKTGQWKIYDMVAEGISLLSAKQSELSGLIRDKGIDAVSRQLNEHVAATATK
ncbi:MAG: ABC transporter substrate-binding protein [Ruminobacter sp.]|uniref:MlaC/ttg2D family ABC transporter substrate-binding protein n=1 Tax=Ruminobacter sp. TaxID=2774296 RepID=UPI001B55DD43|nr:ABC transporter substrate-binding protein [Ruminobacter sp.]MBP3749566.1 ABC transporter substrate-binding protein [Ruminobacter sp.]